MVPTYESGCSSEEVTSGIEDLRLHRLFASEEAVSLSMTRRQGWCGSRQMLRKL